MRNTKWFIRPGTLVIIGFLIAVTSVGVVRSAYHHMGEIDSGIFLTVYPEKAGTKLDNCNTCHSGGSYVNTSNKTVTLGSCQWCHYKYGYDASGNIDETLNAYGKAYKSAGRSTAGVIAIEKDDSDGDGYTNKAEIAANRYPGDANDTPAKVAAPYRVYTRQQLEKMPQHTQFMLMNTHKSDDFYAEYTGVPLENLLRKILLPSATNIIAYSPDGFSQYHPLTPDPDPIFYHIFGRYPAAQFYYDVQADKALNKDGWCDYSAPSVAGRYHGQPINNPQGLKTILAIKRDGQYLTPGKLTPQNKLDGEGPFRVVPPQKIPGPPDQKSSSKVQNVIWPFNNDADHSAGFSARTVTIIKVAPLPAGTTEPDLLEAGWPYADDQNPRIMIYGSIDPVPTIKEKLAVLSSTLWHSKMSSFTHWGYRSALATRVNLVQKWVMLGWYSKAVEDLKGHVLIRTDGCTANGAVDSNDWVADCEFQKQLYWSINEVLVLLDIVN